MKSLNHIHCIFHHPSHIIKNLLISNPPKKPPAPQTILPPPHISNHFMLLNRNSEQSRKSEYMQEIDFRLKRPSKNLLLPNSPFQLS
ncbi:unnamed protein product [Trifolium pratense]|uniref:Uncharacterized protein n=1 Tax=Trifolium pratense TaxID=57577 RepID=A0ACB0LAQ1_TRIPR|nr:unnamed protein product [Trifolium pratense]